MENVISKFFEEDYRRYAFYVLENRAIPSCIDGFKPTQRKIIYAADKFAKGSKIKVNALSGLVIANCQYHHGDVSCSEAIINMAQQFKNNLSLLEDIGVYGSLKNPHASSPRYISTKLSNHYYDIFKDSNLLVNEYVDGYMCEPKHYLPLIPMVLVNGSSGIAVGHATNILNRNVLHIIRACLLELKGNDYDSVPPHINGFIGDWVRDSDNDKRWIIRGKFETLTKNTVVITELPPSITYKAYEEHLEKMVDDKLIVSYKNLSRDNVYYHIKFKENAINGTNIYKKLKLEEYQTENFTTLDETGKLRIFESDKEIIKYFVNFRLGFYQKRKDRILQDLEHKKSTLGNRGKFIKMILEGKLEVKNRPKADIVKDLETIGFTKQEDNYDYLLKMQLWSLTFEMFEKLKADFKEVKQQIEETLQFEPKEMYRLDLVELYKKLKD